MSRSIHVTVKSVAGLSKAEILEQYQHPEGTDLQQLGRKSTIKKEVRQARRRTALADKAPSDLPDGA